ncbi:MAG: NADH-quinone oxidoreductase subunit J family protein [Acidobacteriaceae bacterium]
MTISFLLLAAITITGTAAAMSLKNAVHCVLALTLGMVGLAALYLQLGAEFVGLTQILVYVGAVAILAVFAIMMTRSRTSETVVTGPDPSRFSGVVTALLLFTVLAVAICTGVSSQRLGGATPEVTVHQVGVVLMQHFVLPLEIIGVLLTAALIGAGVLAIEEKGEGR